MKPVVVCFALFLVSGSNLIAQSVVPPPGFSPGQNDDPITAPFTQPRTYSGSTDFSNPSSGSNFLEYPRRSYVPPDGTSGARVYGSRDPVVLFADDNPPMPRFWFRAEALLWWSKGSPLPVPFVTQGSPSDTTPGALGQPGTSVLIGDQTLSLPTQGGGRFTLGFTFDAQQTWGLEGSYFFLSNVSSSTGVASDGSQGSAQLAFPFFNPTTNQEDASPISLPGSFAGSAVVTTQSLIQGTDINFLNNRMNSNGFRYDFLGGFRYVNFQEGLNFTTDSPNVYPNPPAFFHTFDQFNTTNNFYGGQIGIRASYDRPFVFVNATTKLAIGGMFENVAVNGGTFTNSGGYASANGAYFSQPTNIGSTTRDQFAVVPEFNLNFGVRLAPWASFMIGYSFLYLSSAARPGDQIDRVINPSQASAITNNFPGTVTPPYRPDLSVHTSDFWAQGLNFSFELRF